MHSLWFVQWDFTRRDHPGNPGGVSGSGPVSLSTLNCGVLMGSAQGAGSSSVGCESVPGVIISP